MLPAAAHLLPASPSVFAGALPALLILYRGPLGQVTRKAVHPSGWGPLLLSTGFRFHGAIMDYDAAKALFFQECGWPEDKLTENVRTLAHITSRHINQAYLDKGFGVGICRDLESVAQQMATAASAAEALEIHVDRNTGRSTSKLRLS